MQTTPLASRPSRPLPIHAFTPPEARDPGRAALHDGPPEGAGRPPQAVAKAKPMDEPLSDWQVFTLLGGTAGGMLAIGIAALYGIGLLLP